MSIWRGALLALLVVCFGSGCMEDTDPPANAEAGVADARPDAPAPDAAPSDGVAPDGPVVDGPVVDGPVVDGPAADGPAADGPVVDGAPVDAALINDLPSFGDGFNPANYPACNGKVYACADGQDNDGDGLTDAQDPECTGPCDDDEGSFAIGIPGVNNAVCKQDCYWDDDSGGGFDGCEWNLKCDPASPGAGFSPDCPYDQDYVDGGKCPSAQSKKCLDFCLPVTPNGCDCFGCCEIWTAAGKYKDTVFLGSGTDCNTATPQNCAACTQVPDCLNGCGDCELCLGKTLADLPAKCWKTPPPPDGGVPDAAVGDGAVPADGSTSDGSVADGAPPQDGGVVILPIECPEGQDPCIDNSYCTTGYYCVTGCCKGFIN